MIVATLLKVMSLHFPFIFAQLPTELALLNLLEVGESAFQGALVIPRLVLIGKAILKLGYSGPSIRVEVAMFPLLRLCLSRAQIHWLLSELGEADALGFVLFVLFLQRLIVFNQPLPNLFFPFKRLVLFLTVMLLLVRSNDLVELFGLRLIQDWNRNISFIHTHVILQVLQVLV